MDTLTIRQKLHDIIDSADDKKVEEIFIKVIDGTNQPYEWWNDEELIAELDRRSVDLKTGKDKGIPWEEVKSSILAGSKK